MAATFDHGFEKLNSIGTVQESAKRVCHGVIIPGWPGWEVYERQVTWTSGSLDRLADFYFPPRLLTVTWSIRFKNKLSSDNIDDV